MYCIRLHHAHSQTCSLGSCVNTKAGKKRKRQAAAADLQSSSSNRRRPQRRSDSNEQQGTGATAGIVSLGGLVSHQSPARPREAGASRHGFGSAQQDAHQIAPPRLEIGGSSSSPYLTAPDARVVPVGCPYAVVTRARREDLRRDASSTVGLLA